MRIIRFTRELLSHEAHPFIQFVKYGIAGGMATLAGIVVFFLCGWFLFPCLAPDDLLVRLLGVEATELSDQVRAGRAFWCSVISFVTSNTFCYLLNRLFVFKPGRHTRFVEFLLFFAVSGASWFIGVSLQTILIARGGVETSVALGINILAALMINYILRKKVVFRG